MASASSLQPLEGNVALVTDGAAQVAGIGLLIWGLSSPQTVLIRNDFVGAAILPISIGRDGAGLGVVGRF